MAVRNGAVYGGHASRHRPAHSGSQGRHRCLSTTRRPESDTKSAKLQARQTFINHLVSLLLQREQDDGSGTRDITVCNVSTYAEPPVFSTDSPQGGFKTQSHGHEAQTESDVSSRSKSRRQSYIHEKPQDDGDTDSDDEGPNKGKHKRSRLNQDMARVSWACPFRKKHPEMLKESSTCSATGWDTVRRVKEHLLRHHVLSLQCFRCSNIFGTGADLDVHQRNNVACDIRPLTRQGMSLSQELKIRDMKSTGSPVDKWLAMYRILFPHDDITPSPYTGKSDKTVIALSAQESGSDITFEQATSVSEAEASSDSESEVLVPQPKKRLMLYKLLHSINASTWSNLELSTRSALFDEISKLVRVWLSDTFKDTSPANITSCCGSTSQRRCAGGSSSSSSSLNRSRDNASGGQGSGQKRRREDTTSECDENGDDDDGNQERLLESSSKKKAQLKFACPYLKMAPSTYINRKSCLGGWRTAHRLKEHLYRNHRVPETCSRCYETFDDAEQRIGHERAATPCKIAAKRPYEGIDVPKYQALKCKKKLGGTEEEKCRRIYTILWPEVRETDLPSPYWDSSLLASTSEPSGAEFNEFLRQELPQAIRQRLETGFSTSQPISISRVVTMVEHSIRDIYPVFLSQRSASGILGSQDSTFSSSSDQITGSNEATSIPLTQEYRRHFSASPQPEHHQPQLGLALTHLQQQPSQLPLSFALPQGQEPFSLNPQPRQLPFNFAFDLGPFGTNNAFTFGEISSHDDVGLLTPRGPGNRAEQLPSYNMPDMVGHPIVFGNT